MKTFKSKKSKFVRFLPFVISIFFLIAHLSSFESNKPFHLKDLFYTTIMIIVFFSFMYFSSNISYTIEGNELKIKSLLVKKCFDVSKFTQISRNKSKIIKVEKAATSNKGIIIKYTKYDEIFISPENEKEFIEELLKINPLIKIDRIKNEI